MLSDVKDTYTMFHSTNEASTESVVSLRCWSTMHRATKAKWYAKFFADI